MKQILILLCCVCCSGCGSLSAIKAEKAIVAMNRGDVDSYLKDWADDAVFIYPGDASTSGEVHGKTAIRQWFSVWRGMFPDVTFAVKDIYLKDSIYFGMDNVMIVHWEASGTNKYGTNVRSSGLGVVTIKGTKVVRVQDYIFDAHRLKAFWGE